MKRKTIYLQINEYEKVKNLTSDLNQRCWVTSEGHKAIDFDTKDFNYPTTYVFNK